MDETMVAPPGPEDSASDSFFSRAMNVFISPGQAFDSVVRHPDFLVPLLINTASSIILIECMLARIGAAQILRRSLEISGKAAQMAPEDLDRTVQKAAGFTAIIMHVTAVIAPAIYILVIAAIGALIVNAIFGQSTKFNACFAVASYASLVLVVGVVLGLVMVFLGDPQQMNPDNFVPTTVGFFLNPQETPKALYVIFSSFDVFRIWYIVLVSIGLASATGRKVGTTAIFLTYLGMWVICVLGHAGIVALTG